MNYIYFLLLLILIVSIIIHVINLRKKIYRFLNAKRNYIYSRTEPVLSKSLITHVPMFESINTRVPTPRTLTTQYSVQIPTITKHPMPQVFTPRPALPQFSISLPPTSPPLNTKNTYL